MKFDDLKLKVCSKLKNYKVYFSKYEVPSSVMLPTQWSEFGMSKDAGAILPTAWGEFSDRLPSVCEWLHRCVIGTILAVRETTYLGYIYLEDGEVYVYLGGPPLNGIIADKFALIPSRLVDFYVKLHDGFGFYLGMTMGPSETKDFVRVQDISDEDLTDFPKLTGFFSNGAGDYLAVDAVSRDEVGYIWWHEDPQAPEVDVDIWVVMDTWMAIFLESCDSKRVSFD